MPLRRLARSAWALTIFASGVGLAVELGAGDDLRLRADEPGADGREHHRGRHEARRRRRAQAAPEGAARAAGHRRRPAHRLAGTL